MASVVDVELCPPPLPSSCDAAVAAATRLNDISSQLRTFAETCTRRRNNYWKLFYSLRAKNNLISIPMLLLSSATGLTSVSRASAGDACSSKEEEAPASSTALLWSTAILSVTTSFLVAIQRYFAFGERAEQARILAREYGDLARRIRVTVDMYLAGTKPEWGPVELGEFAESVVQEMRKLINVTQDMPLAMLEHER